MSDFGGSKTQLNKRDLWRTQAEVFNALDLEFGFYLDVAADWNNTLCSQFIDEKKNALGCDWVSYGAIFCNPPYSDNPRFFFVTGVKHGRIVLDEETGKIAHRYLSKVSKEEYPTFRDVFNKLNKQCREKQEAAQ